MKARRILMPLMPTNPQVDDFEFEWNENIRLLILCLGKDYIIWLINKEKDTHDYDEGLHGDCELQDH